MNVKLEEQKSLSRHFKVLRSLKPMKKLSILTALFFCFLFTTNLIFAATETPTLSLKDSIPIAEAALTKNQIDASQYFIFSVAYTNSKKGYFWHYTYRPVSQQSIGNEIHLRVYMDKTTEVLSG